MRESADLAERRGSRRGLARRSQRTDHPPPAHRRAAGRSARPSAPRQRGGDAAAERCRRTPRRRPRPGHSPRPALAQRLATWRTDGRADDTPLQLAPDLPDVVPRFTRLRAGSDQVLIFLDDTSIVSRQAESLTLATLGRFSASLAHEIRNPLAAINYAVQLLEESKDLPTADLRLLEIVRQQGQRMNGIVENVLGLARREHAKPEHVELMAFARRFVEDYAASHPLEHDTLRATGPLPARQHDDRPAPAASGVDGPGLQRPDLRSHAGPSGAGHRACETRRYRRAGDRHPRSRSGRAGVGGRASCSVRSSPPPATAPAWASTSPASCAAPTRPRWSTSPCPPVAPASASVWPRPARCMGG